MLHVLRKPQGMMHFWWQSFGAQGDVIWVRVPLYGQCPVLSPSWKGSYDGEGEAPKTQIRKVMRHAYD